MSPADTKPTRFRVVSLDGVVVGWIHRYSMGDASWTMEHIWTDGGVRLEYLESDQD